MAEQRRIPLDQTSALQQREWLAAGRKRLNQQRDARAGEALRQYNLAEQDRVLRVRRLIQEAVDQVEREEAARFSGEITGQEGQSAESLLYAEQMAQSPRWRGAGGPPQSVAPPTVRQRIYQRAVDLLENSPDELQPGRTLGPFGRGRGERYRDPFTLQWRLRRGTVPTPLDGTMFENPQVPPEIQAANPGSAAYLSSNSWMPETRRQLAARIYNSQLPGSLQLSIFLAPTTNNVVFSQNLQTYGFDPRASPTGSPLAGQRPMPGALNTASFLWRDSKTLRSSVAGGFSSAFGHVRKFAGGVPSGLVGAFNAPGNAVFGLLGGGNDPDADYFKYQINSRVLGFAYSRFKGAVFSLVPDLTDIIADAVTRKTRLALRPEALTPWDIASSAIQTTAKLPFMGLGDTPFQVGREALWDSLARYSGYNSKVNNRQALETMFSVYAREGSESMSRHLAAERVGNQAANSQMGEMDNGFSVGFRSAAADVGRGMDRLYYGQGAAHLFYYGVQDVGSFLQKAGAGILGKEDPSKFVDTSKIVVGHHVPASERGSDTWNRTLTFIQDKLTLMATAFGAIISRAYIEKTKIDNEQQSREF